MTENEIFNRALNLGTGWEVYDVTFKPDQKELSIFILTVKGSLHTCGTCGKPGCRIYDHGKEREWRHMNFFQYRAVLIGKPPRVECVQCNTLKQPNFLGHASVPVIRCTSKPLWGPANILTKIYAKPSNIIGLAFFYTLRGTTSQIM